MPIRNSAPWRSPTSHVTAIPAANESATSIQAPRGDDVAIATFAGNEAVDTIAIIKLRAGARGSERAGGFLQLQPELLQAGRYVRHRQPGGRPADHRFGIQPDALLPEHFGQHEPLRCGPVSRVA